METPTRLWLNLCSFCVKGGEGLRTLSDKVPLGSSHNRLNITMAGGGEPQVGRLCGCKVLCVRVRLYHVYHVRARVCVFNRVCSGAGSSGAPPGPPGTV